jgi:hypothetical protein
MLERRRDLAHTLDRLDNALLVVAGVVVVALVFHVLAWTVGLIYSFGRVALFILAVGLIVRFFARRR